MTDGSEVVLVTGWPGFIAKRLVRTLAAKLHRERDRLVLFTRARHVAAARAELDALGIPGEVMEGDVTRIHLGLSGPEWKSLTAEVTRIWHLAALYDVGAPALEVRAVNVDGTRNALELARAARRLRRYDHFSTAYVSGDRQGVILEDELEMGQRFHDAYERSKYEAELLVRRAMAEVPATIHRPSIVVGDSRTGEIDRFDGPYYLAILLVASPVAVPLPLPGNGVAPLNVVPVDFVVNAAIAIDANPAAVGRTVHLVDPSPLSARRVYELVASRAGKELPPITLSHRAVEAFLGLPFLGQAVRERRNAIRLVNQLALYNPRRQLELLAGTGISCPPITDYLDRLTDFVQRNYMQRPHAMSPDADDPLDPRPEAGGGCA